MKDNFAELKDARIIPALIKVHNLSINQFRSETPFSEERHNIMWKFGSWVYAEKIRNGMNLPIDENHIIRFLLEAE